MFFSPCASAVCMERCRVDCAGRAGCVRLLTRKFSVRRWLG